MTRGLENYYSTVFGVVLKTLPMLQSLFFSRLSIEIMSACMNELELAQKDNIVSSSRCYLVQNGNSISLKLIMGENDPENFLGQLINGAIYYTVGRGNYRTLPDGSKEISEGAAPGNFFLEREGSNITENTEKVVFDMFDQEVSAAAESPIAMDAAGDYMVDVALNFIEGDA